MHELPRGVWFGSMGMVNGGICLFVCFINKTRAVKPLGRSHSRILSFTQDGPAVSTAIYKLTSWLGFQDQQSMLTSPETPHPTQNAP